MCLIVANKKKESKRKMKKREYIKESEPQAKQSGKSWEQKGN